jgi:hypothetical protein
MSLGVQRRIGQKGPTVKAKIRSAILRRIGCDRGASMLVKRAAPPPDGHTRPKAVTF